MAEQSPRDPARLRARRVHARRRRRLARLDVGLGLVCALVLVIASPGLAIAGVVALAVLLVCALSLLWDRLAVRRAARKRDQPPPAEP
jgi:site-specific recombinase